KAKHLAPTCASFRVKAQLALQTRTRLEPDPPKKPRSAFRTLSKTRRFPPLRLSEEGVRGEARRPLDILHLTPQTREARNLMRLRLNRLLDYPTARVVSTDGGRTRVHIGGLL